VTYLKAKAFVAVRITTPQFTSRKHRKESADASVQGVVTFLLMNSLSEQGDYNAPRNC